MSSFIGETCGQMDSHDHPFTDSVLFVQRTDMNNVSKTFDVLLVTQVTNHHVDGRNMQVIIS
jgi:hypothetical protein